MNFVTLQKKLAMKTNLSNGLAKRAGRPISDGQTGIQAALEMKKMRKREDKISMMETAMYRAEMMADMREKSMGYSCD
jgi:hypothetical protein